MEKKDRSSRRGMIRFDPLSTSSSKVILSELSEALKKLEHRAEVFTSISREQEIFGYHELAQAYRKQAAESRAYAQSIRKSLDLGQGEVGWNNLEKI